MFSYCYKWLKHLQYRYAVPTKFISKVLLTLQRKIFRVHISRFLVAESAFREHVHAFFSDEHTLVGSHLQTSRREKNSRRKPLGTKTFCVSRHQNFPQNSRKMPLLISAAAHLFV